MAALTIGSPCASLAAASSSHLDRPALARLPAGRLQFGCFFAKNGAVSTCAARSSISPLRAVAVDSDQSESPLPSSEAKPKKYYFVVANAKFMLDEEEHFQEQLAERLRLFAERGREQDFWLVIEPKFLDKFPNVAKRLKRPAVALVSTDGPWITFMKLRLDRVLTESFEADSLAEALASSPVDVQFERPKNWVAPYPKYESGWWQRFLPPNPSQPEA
ncbi:YCF54 isoform X2 [Wolffia australiana]